MKALQRILGEHFDYKTELSPEQFCARGFGERKMVLVCEVYDLVKRVRRETKVSKRIRDNVDPKWEHPCDEALKQYAVCDHGEKLVKEMQFKMNPTLLSSKLSVMNVHKIDQPANDQENEDKQSQCSAFPPEKPMKVFSVTDHFRRAEQSAAKSEAAESQKDQTVASPARDTFGAQEAAKMVIPEKPAREEQDSDQHKTRETEGTQQSELIRQLASVSYFTPSHLFRASVR